ncbi:MAG: hypothetical protein Q4F60_02025, partial [Candidatus Saccharibacteria bacterium]|nr:hypothetical protein [Candidatus Saccharibacteria bacterium]
YSYYIPWADMESAPAGTYTMQQFTAKACSEMATPAAYTGTIAGGDYQAVTNVPEVSLKDARNTNHVYRVRKLADGNCWMADNLRLTLDDSVALTSVNSDINYNMDTGISWDGKTTTETRTISNPLKVNGPVLGTYSTGNDGVISWTPYVDTQTNEARGISWGSPYTNCTDKNSDGYITDNGMTSSENECTYATSGQKVTAKYFMAAGSSEESVSIASAEFFTNVNVYSEAARSYNYVDTMLTDGDGFLQYYGTHYNWYAATAGSGTWASSAQWKDTDNSVCPANWQLPDAATGDDKSFKNLFIYYKIRVD